MADAILTAAEITAMRAAIAAQYDASPTGQRRRQQDRAWRLLTTLDAALAIVAHVADANPLADDWEHAQVTVPFALVLQARQMLGK
jgi:hypothetical protein